MRKNLPHFTKYLIGFSLALIAVSNCFNVLSSSSWFVASTSNDTTRVATSKAESLTTGNKSDGGRSYVFLSSPLNSSNKPSALPWAGLRTASLASPTSATVTATKTASLDTDVNGNGKVNPGDTLKYSVVISASGMDATGVSFSDTLDTNTTFVGGSTAASPVAVDDTYPQTVIGNVSINSANIPYSVTSNDFLGVNPTATIDQVQSVTTISSNTITATSAQGGTVVMTVSGAGIGQFTYNPPAGYEGTDTFTYRLADNANATSASTNRTGTVTLTISGMVWFINNNAGACTSNCDGRLSNPFTTLAAFQAVNDGTGNHPAANDNIFIYESGTAYTGPVTLLSGQKLIGQDSTASLSTITGLTPPSGSASFPVMNSGNGTIVKITSAGNAINLNSSGTSNLIRGLTIGSTTGIGINGTGFGTLTVADVAMADSPNRTGQALSLTTGTLAATFASIESKDSAARGISLTGVGGSLTSTTTTVTNPSGSGTNGIGIFVDTSSATLSFGTTSVTGSAGTGISLTTNTGTITFGALTITPDASQKGLVATNNTNTITTTSGTITTSSNTAVEITRTGACCGTTTPLAINLTTVSANGGTSGIVMTNTSGSFTVVGTGTANSGGVIQNTTSHGVALTNVQNITFQRFSIHNTGNHGIFGDGVNVFTFRDSTIFNFGDATPSSGATEDAMHFESTNTANTAAGHGLTGIVTIQRDTIGPDGHFVLSPNPPLPENKGIVIRNHNDAQLTMTVTGTTFTQISDDGIDAEVSWNDTVNSPPNPAATLNVDGSTADGTNTFDQINGRSITYSGPADNAKGETLELTIKNNTFTKVGIGGRWFAAARTTVNARYNNNTMTTTYNDAIRSIADATDATLTPHATVNATISGNTFGGGSAFIQNHRSATQTTAFTSNTNIGGTPAGAGGCATCLEQGGGVFVGSDRGSTLNIDFTNNTATADGSPTVAANALYLQAVVNGGGASTICANVTGNTLTENPDTGGQFVVVLDPVDAGSTIKIEGGSGGSPNTENYLIAHNTLNGANKVGISDPTRVPSGVGADCVTSTPMAPEEVQASAGQLQPDSTDQRQRDDSLLAFYGERKSDYGVARLSQAELLWMVQAAIERWRAAGISDEDLARIQQVTFEIADLPAGQIAARNATRIQIDETAAGYGWFFDQTPQEDSEFLVPVPGRELQTTEYSPAFDKMDLLTVVMRELGSVYLDSKKRMPKSLRPLMETSLAPGVRRLPDARTITLNISLLFDGSSTSNLAAEPSAAAGYGRTGRNDKQSPALKQLRLAPVSYTKRSNGSSLRYAMLHRPSSAASFSPMVGPDVSVSVGTLPAGKSVSIVFKATINNPLPTGVFNVCNQGTVSGTNFSNVLTDDPGTGTANDATCTQVCVPPTISTALTNQQVAQGTTATFTTTFTGTVPFVPVWKKNGATLVSGTSLGGRATITTTTNTGAGTTTTTLTISNTVVSDSDTYTVDATDNCGTAATQQSATLTVVAPPTVTKSFSPTSIPQGGTSTLTFTVTNPNASVTLTGVNFSDNLPPGLEVANPAGISSTCTGTWNATPGDTTLNFGGGTLPPNSSCTLMVNIKGTTAGVKANTTNAPQSNEGGTGVASNTATLTVVGPPTITKSFATANIAASPTGATESGNTVTITTTAVHGFTAGQTVTIAGVGVAGYNGTFVIASTPTTSSFTYVNGSSGLAASGGGTATVVAIPLGSTTTLSFTVTNPNTTTTLTGVGFTDTLPAGLTVATSGPTSTCGGNVTTTAPDTITLTGASIAPSGSCTFSVTVTGATAGVKNNTTGQVTSNEGGTGTTSNTATLTVVAPPTISKSFGAANIAVGGTTSLTFTITNPNTTVSLTGVGFTDTLPTGLTVADSGPTATCGGTLTTTNATGVISLSGATIGTGAGNTCTFSVTVTGTTSGTKNNTTGAVTSANGGTGTTSNTAAVTVATPPTIAKSFGASSVLLGGTTSLTFTLTNPNASLNLTGISFTDTLPAGVTVATSGPTSTCGGTLSTTSPSTITFTGGTLGTGASNSCNFSVTVTGSSTGVWNNTTGVISSNESGAGATSNTATLTVVGPPSISKSFDAATIPLNGTSVLTFTVTNPNTTTAFTGVTFTDTLPAGLTVPNGTSTVCGGGTLTTTAPDTITLTGGAIGTSTNCSFSVTVTGATAGVKNNTTGNVSAANGGTGGTGSASITVLAPPTISKAFGSANIPLGGTTSLTFTVTNPNSTVSLTGVGFTDTLPAGLTVPNDAGSSHCGGTLTITGNNMIVLSGATVAFGTPCTISLTVTGTTAGVKNNQTTAVTSTNGGTGSASNVATVTVATPPTISKSFGSSSVLLGATTSLTFTLTNPNASLNLTGISFTDTLPAGVTVATSGPTSTCGGTLSTTSPSTITFTGGTLGTGASSSCNFSVTVTGSTAGVWNNTTGVISSSESGAGATSNTATLTVVGPPSISKSFDAATVPLNGTSVLTFTVTNPNTTTAFTGVTFTDTLPAGLTVPSGTSTVCGGGTLTTTAPDTITLTGGAIGTSTNCSFSVTVTGTTAGVKNNTTGNVSAANGGTGGTGSASITVLAPPTISKSFNPTSIPLGGTSMLTFTITNPNSTVSLTGVGFTDTLPAGVTVADSSTSQCGGTLTTTNATGVISLSGATVAFGTPCTFSVTVTGATAGVKNNTTGAVTSANGGTGTTSNTATLTVAAAPTITKSFGSSSVLLGATTSLTFTITNPNASQNLTGISFTDTLPSGVTVATSGPTSTCGGTLTTTSPDTITFTGGTLAGAGSCNFSVTVTGSTTGVWNNTTGAISSNESGAGATSNTATLTVVGPPSISKSFDAATIPLGGTSVLTFTVTNPNTTTTLNGVAFTDTLPAGLTVANGSSSQCGGTLTTTAPNSISFSGGTIGSSGNCMITVTVTGATAGVKNNTTGAVSASNGGTGGTGTASITVVAPPMISKSFNPAHITPGNTTSLTFTITNPNSTVSLTGVAFTDTLPSGLTVADSSTSQCSGTATTTSATETIALSGASIGPSSNCTFSVTVTATTPGIKHNVSGNVTSTNGGTGNAAMADMTAGTPPTITCPSSPVMADAAPNLCSATVSFTVNATGDPAPTVTCTPASGSVFPVGNTTVTCTASNMVPPDATCSFTVQVKDTQAPVFTNGCPSSMTIVAQPSCPFATSVSASFTTPVATDNCTANPTVVCSPPSGSMFPVGTTTVTCTATDASNNTATCTFAVNAWSFCLQDDSSPGNVVFVNATTGDYLFCSGGVQIASGRGTLTVRGCQFGIEHIKGDRKVIIGGDTSANSGLGAGNAVITKTNGHMVIQITDKNMTNNTCSCSSAPPMSPRDPGPPKRTIGN